MAAASPTERTRAFISYSHADAKYLADLKVHLASLTRDGKVDVWDDTRIAPGTLWFDEIKQAIRTAKVAIFLISPNFLASDFIARQELPALLAAARQEGAVILSVILRPCRFDQTELARYQTVSPPSHPLAAMSQVEQDEVWVRLTELVENTLNPKPQPPPHYPTQPPAQPFYPPAPRAAPFSAPPQNLGMLSPHTGPMVAAEPRKNVPQVALPRTPVQRWLLACLIGLLIGHGIVLEIIPLYNYAVRGVGQAVMLVSCIFIGTLVAGWLTGKLLVQRWLGVAGGIFIYASTEFWSVYQTESSFSDAIQHTFSLNNIFFPLILGLMSFIACWLATVRHPYYRKPRE